MYDAGGSDQFVSGIALEVETGGGAGRRKVKRPDVQAVDDPFDLWIVEVDVDSLQLASSHKAMAATPHLLSVRRSRSRLRSFPLNAKMSMCVSRLSIGIPGYVGGIDVAFDTNLVPQDADEG